jgi:hypothetical protein
MEVRPPVRLQPTNLAIEDGAATLDDVRDFFCELRAGLEAPPVPRDKFAPMAGHTRERTEPVWRLISTKNTNRLRADIVAGS